MTEEEPVGRLAPVSLIGIPLAVVAYLAQTIPLVGVFLMMLMAIAWPGLLVLAAMVGTALEAITGRVSRWWLVLPAIVLGGYEAFAFADHLTAWRLQDREAVVGGIPVRDRDIVIIGDGSKDLAERIVETRIVDSVHEAILDDGRTIGYVSRRLAPSSQCGSLRSSDLDHRVGIMFFHAPSDPHGQRKLDSGACLLDLDDVPETPAITIRVAEGHGTVGSMPVTMRIAIVSNPGFTPIRIRSHTSRPLSWIPFLLAGCGLNSADPSWQCAIAPIRVNAGDPWSYGMIDRISLALRLEERIPGTVPDIDVRSIIHAAARRTTSARALRIAHDDELLDRLASDPALPLTVSDVERLARQPDVVGPRASELEQIVDNARLTVEPIMEIPVECAFDDQRSSCRYRRIASNASLLDGLLQWRIDPSALATDDRRMLLSIRRRMRSRDREEALKQRGPR